MLYITCPGRQMPEIYLAPACPGPHDPLLHGSHRIVVHLSHKLINPMILFDFCCNKHRESAMQSPHWQNAPRYLTASAHQKENGRNA